MTTPVERLRRHDQRPGTAPAAGSAPTLPPPLRPARGPAASEPAGDGTAGSPASTWRSRQRPGGPTLPPAAGDLAAERQLRADVRREISRLLDEQQLLAPRREDETRIQLLIRERVVAYQRNAAVTNAPLIQDPSAVERRLFDHLLRLGPLQTLMDDPTVEEIIVNHPRRVFCIAGGRKYLADEVVFDDDEEVRQLVKRLIGPLGRRLDEASPMVDARLPDGSRLNAAIPPATTRWCAVNIRRFLLRAHSLEQLVSLGTLTPDAAQFLEAAVQAGTNIVVSGSTGSGKTTLVNCLGTAIPSAEERVVTVEETAELALEHTLPDCVALQARAGNIEGAGEIRIRDLVRNALRMRPTRIIIGEVRGGEALDMLLAMNTGHEGSLSTLHANSARDAIDRLVLLASMAEERLPTEALTRLVAKTIELVVQLRFEPRTGRRRVASIFEVTGLEGDVITGNELWTLDPVADRLIWRGIQPRCLAKMAARGVAYALPPLGSGPRRAELA